MTDTAPLLSETADVETSSSDYARRFSGSVGEWFLRVQEEATLRMVAPHPGARILDVGGGHGQIAGALIRDGYHVTVLGSATTCVERIEHLVDGRRCVFQVGSVLNLPFEDRSFDVVVSLRLLPHVSRWGKLLAELARVGRTAVIVDYPAVVSLNFVAPYLFSLKMRLEGNTRPYSRFVESELVGHFSSLGFLRADRFPQFLLPMVFHRMLKSAALSQLVEGCFRRVGLTDLLGSPVILKFVRKWTQV